MARLGQNRHVPISTCYYEFVSQFLPSSPSLQNSPSFRKSTKGDKTTEMPLPPGIVQCANCGLYDQLVGMYFLEGNVYCLVCKPEGALRIVEATVVPDDVEQV